MVTSTYANTLLPGELLEIQENLKNSDYAEIERFRESLQINEMGFEGRREGI